MDSSSRIIPKIPILLLPILGVVVFSLFRLNLLEPAPYSPIMLSDEGRLLSAQLADDEQWRFSPVESLPEKYVKALLVYEDKRFYQHFGIDPIAVSRSLYLNLKNKRIVSGASTLTMQTVRLLRGNPARTYLEKIQEAALAILLELTESKATILNYYANHAPFGGNTVGINTASWRYFNRPLNQLSWAESATLAILPNSPAAIRPGKNHKKFKDKRDRLLVELYTLGVINEQQYKLALLEPLPEKVYRFPQNGFHLLNTLSNAYPDQYVFNTTIDHRLQLQFESMAEYQGVSLADQGIENLAAILIDNDTMKVKSYVGNRALGFKRGTGLAIDLIHRPRSTGSLLKPFLYTLMIDKGYITPRQLIPDVPMQLQGYSPENYDRTYRGAVPAHFALAQSLNIPAIEMLQTYGVGFFLSHLKKLGMSTLKYDANYYGLPLVLGGAETTLWDMGMMYANLARVAKERKVSFRELSILESFDYSQTQNGTSHPKKDWPALYSQGAAWLTIDALKEVSRPEQFSYWSNFSSTQNIAWKTGTSYGNKDGWAIGFNKKYTIGVWVGNANGEGVAKLTGGRSAAPLLFNLFSALPKSEWFSEPHLALESVSVCQQDGMMANRYCETTQQKIPKGAPIAPSSTNVSLIHVDKRSTMRVNNDCRPIHQIEAVPWFQLPPIQEYYYRRIHSDYQRPPKWAPDCKPMDGGQAMSFIYPKQNNQIVIPVMLNKQESSLVAQLAHQYKDRKVFWHLNGEYIGVTEDVHEMAINAKAGQYRLNVVDEKGEVAHVDFQLL